MKINDILKYLKEQKNIFDQNLYDKLEFFIRQNIRDLNIDIIKQMIEKETFLYRGLSDSSSKKKYGLVL